MLYNIQHAFSTRVVSSLTKLSLILLEDGSFKEVKEIMRCD